MAGAGAEGRLVESETESVPVWEDGDVLGTVVVTAAQQCALKMATTVTFR